jgi:hypothetical protein
MLETQLPSAEHWEVGNSEIEWAKYVYNKWGCKNLCDYIKLYLEIDIILLCEIFEKFRRTSQARYILDPSWYFTLPGYSWYIQINLRSCALRYTKTKLELLNSHRLVEFFIKDAIRGGISTVCRKKHLKANNKYMGDLYNPNLPDNYILYLDVTNLYGHSMCQKLPVDGFRFVDPNEIDINNLNPSKGYIFEVDIEYPIELHRLHIDLPFFPEHINKRLCPTLNNKYNYKV